MEQRWAEIEAAYERIRRQDPDGWHDYLGELAEVSAGEPDATTAEKWPEVATLDDGRIAVRNSRHPDGSMVFVTRAELDAWVEGVKAGEIDGFG